MIVPDGGVRKIFLLISLGFIFFMAFLFASVLKIDPRIGTNLIFNELIAAAILWFLVLFYWKRR